MIGLLRSEWIKWRSLRSSWTLWLCIIGITIALGVLFAIAISTNNPPNGEARSTTDLLVALGGNPLLLLLTFVLLSVIGALIITTEYSQNTIAPTFLSTPRRIPVLAAKLLLAALIGIVTAVIAQALVVAIGSGILGLNDIATPSTSTVLTQFAETATYAACGVLFGFAIGMLLRQSVFAVVTCIVWAVLLEPIGSAIFTAIVGEDTGGKIIRFLPITSLNGLLTLGREPGNHPEFPPLVSLGIFLAWVAIAVTIGGFFVNRADTK